MKRWALLPFVLGTLGMPSLTSAEKPCDDYLPSKQTRCETLWKQINADAASEMARFGLDQLKRRQEGKISREQHVQENMAFIKQSADKRLRLLSELMSKK